MDESGRLIQGCGGKRIHNSGPASSNDSTRLDRTDARTSWVPVDAIADKSLSEVPAISLLGCDLDHSIIRLRRVVEEPWDLLEVLVDGHDDPLLNHSPLLPDRSQDSSNVVPFESGEPLAGRAASQPLTTLLQCHRRCTALAMALVCRIDVVPPVAAGRVAETDGDLVCGQGPLEFGDVGDHPLLGLFEVSSAAELAGLPLNGLLDGVRGLVGHDVTVYE